MGLRASIQSAAGSAGLSISPTVEDRLKQYYELLQSWNRRVNLTALPLEGFPKPTIDRLLIEPLISAQLVNDEVVEILDLGSGGGSPAIPLKIARPKVRLTMVEARQKKTSFLREVVRQLSLHDTFIVNERIETMNLEPDYRASIVTVRALRIEPSMLDRVGVWILPSSRFFLFGGSDPIDPRLSRVETINLPGTGQRLAVWRWTNQE